MTDLLAADQVAQIRSVMNDISDTFAFPVTIIKTTFVEAAFQTNPTTVEHETDAIRSYNSLSQAGQYRNGFSVDDAGEWTVYLGWDKCKTLGLIDSESKPLINENDLVRMQDEIYEILAVGPVADMTKEPVFLALSIKRRFADPDGAGGV